VHATTLALLLSARVSPRDGPDALPPLAVDALHNPVPPRPPHRLARAGAGRAHAAGLAWGHGVAYGKFLFAPGAFGEATGADPPPPRGLRWAEVAGRDLETVVRAMETPRRVGTVGLLAGVGLRAEEAAEGAAEGAELVAWGFLSVDGSLASLYTDPQLRGRGMGKAVGKRLGRMVQAGDGARMDGERDEAGMAFRGVRPGGDWVHADVMAANIGSVKVMEGLGGVWAWDCHWCWLDLELVDRVSWGDEESSSAIEMQKGEQLR
jgi:GNAT superfamily N-acetyltransferase